MAGNQLGKTWAGANEMAMHLTGAYPDWWQGRRFGGRCWIMASFVRLCARAETAFLVRPAQQAVVGEVVGVGLWLEFPLLRLFNRVDQRL